MQKQDLLPEQKLEDLVISKLSPLSPHVMARQATINIGLHRFCRRFVAPCD